MPSKKRPRGIQGETLRNAMKMPPPLKIVPKVKAEIAQDIRELAEDVLAKVVTDDDDVAVEGLAVVMVMADGTNWIRVTKTTVRHKMLAGIVDLLHDYQRNPSSD